MMSFNRTGENIVSVVVIQISFILYTRAQVKCTRNEQFLTSSRRLHNTLECDAKFVLKRNSEKKKRKK